MTFLLWIHEEEEEILNGTIVPLRKILLYIIVRKETSFLSIESNLSTLGKNTNTNKHSNRHKVINITHAWDFWDGEASHLTRRYAYINTGLNEGFAVGWRVGIIDGTIEGWELGKQYGFHVGEVEGLMDGSMVGWLDGLEGVELGCEDGMNVGWEDGWTEGKEDGHKDGWEDG